MVVVPALAYSGEVRCCADVGAANESAGPRTAPVDSRADGVSANAGSARMATRFDQICRILKHVRHDAPSLLKMLQLLSGRGEHAGLSSLRRA